jgi:hypothetical protein
MRVPTLMAVSLVAVAACGPAVRFSQPLPAGVPSTEGWEKSEARAELDDPRRTVEYQLFVSPKRSATYEVIRYRITYADPAERERSQYTANEQLQWDLDGRRLRRFELMPGDQGARWEELTAGSERFRRQTPAILSLLALHRELLYRREAGQ